MANFKKIARRTFLLGTAAIAGGVAFGVYKLTETPENPLMSDRENTALNAFVIINQEGVTIVTPKAEMGQGVQSTWAALVAEELDVDWQDIRVTHGPAAQAYYNSALFGLALPFLDFEVTGWQEELRQFAGNGAKLLSLQLTGGSTSMRDGYERARLAGATARETLKLAAAQEWSVSVDQLRTDAGQVIAPDGRVLTYQELAPKAAEIDPPRVTLRDPADWKYLGKSMPRLDMPGKATGTATFGIDVRLEGMRFASLRKNPKRSGMVRFDASVAETMPGVEKIVPFDDGVAVVASNTWLAIQAVNAIEIEWEDAAYPPTTEGLFKLFEDGFATEVNAVGRDEGDVDDAHEGTRLSAEYKVPWLAHTTMEPMNATALFGKDTLTVWCGNQAPGSAQTRCALAVGLEPEQVTINTTLMGGGFGRRGETDFSVAAAQVAKSMPGVPVQLTWSREEDMLRDYYRPGALARFSGVVKDGEAISLDGHISSASVVQQSGARASDREMSGADREQLGGASDQPYGIPNYRVSGYVTPVRLPVGYWRSVGSSFGGFFFDTFIDEMAHAANADPLGFRLELARKSHEPSAIVIQTVADMSGWGSPKGDNVGRGVAFTYSFGTAVAQIVEVEESDGQIGISKVWIAADMGRALDPRNVEAQLTGGCLYGLSAAVMGEVTFDEGQIEQTNFPDYDALRMHNAPAFEVQILENNRFIGGIGEPGTPPAAPALGNALFDLTGTRARELPFSKTFDLIL